MAEAPIKKEKCDGEDDIFDDSFPDLTEILEEVKREDVASSDEESIRQKGQITESCINELFNASESEEISSDAEILVLQKLLEKKKKELKQSGKFSKSRSCQQGDSKKRKGSKSQCNRSKRKKINFGNDGRSESPNVTESLASVNSNSINDVLNKTIQIQASVSDVPTNGNDNNSSYLMSSNTDIKYSIDIEMEQLLKTDDYNSDEEQLTFDQAVPSTSSELPYTYPPIFNLPNQVANNSSVAYPVMYNVGLQPQFFPPNMRMPFIDFGHPQVNTPAVENELECLPVVNEVGFSGMPSFKRIKLERNSIVTLEKVEEITGDPRRKVFQICKNLLKHMEIDELSGSFIHTSTVTQQNSVTASNSIVQRISNVGYEFHSIGSQLKLGIWGLKEIRNRNLGIAKKIGISADKYFTKIAEKANTIARKLIKVEDTKADCIQQEMETEEPTLSSFLKNSVTQTDPLVCWECIARKRKVGHDIGVQTTIYTSSIDTQTSSDISDENEHLTVGLSKNQLKALFAFSHLIREPPKNTSAELFRLRENLLNIYNVSQRPYTFASFMSSSSSAPPPPHISQRDPRNSRVPPAIPLHRTSEPLLQEPVHSPPSMNFPSYPTTQIATYEIHKSQYSGRQETLSDFEYTSTAFSDPRRIYSQRSQRPL